MEEKQVIKCPEMGSGFQLILLSCQVQHKNHVYS